MCKTIVYLYKIMVLVIIRKIDKFVTGLSLMGRVSLFNFVSEYRYWIFDLSLSKKCDFSGNFYKYVANKS